MNPHNNLSPENLEALDQAVTACQKITGRPYADIRASILSIFTAYQQQDPQPSTVLQPEPIRITRPGWHAESGLWFFGNIAFNDEGNAYIHEADGTYIIKGTSYLPDFGIHAPVIGFDTPINPQDAMEEIFHSIYKDFGGYEGILALGGAISYLFAPELIGKYGCHPGIWIHGTMASGKTTLARILMSLFGSECGHDRLELQGSTYTAMERTLADYSNLPVCFDHWREDRPSSHTYLIRGCFTRTGRTKGKLDDSNRISTVILSTSPIIISELPPEDAATASRYLQIHLSRSDNPWGREQILRNHLAMRHYSLIISSLFERGRGAAAEKFMAYLSESISFLRAKNPSACERSLLVNSIAYASFATVFKPICTTEIHTGLLAHLVTRISDNALHPAPGTLPDPQPELPPLGHNLTYPKDAREIQHLGERLPQVMRAIRTILEISHDEAHQELLSYRRLALKHNRTDSELFDCLLAWSKLGRTGQALRQAVETSLAAAAAAEKPTE